MGVHVRVHVRVSIVDHPSEYPWSSYHANALGHHNVVIKPHELYTQLGNTPIKRQTAYNDLFKHLVSNKTLDEIRNPTNKAWVLGNDFFKERIEKQLPRRIKPATKGGDRKSKQFQKSRSIN